MAIRKIGSLMRLKVAYTLTNFPTMSATECVLCCEAL